MAIITRICPVCRNEFRREINRTKKYIHCSSKCSGASLRKAIIIDCSECHKTISKQPSHISNNNFCSRLCQSRWYSKNNKGDKAVNWKGGITKINGYFFKLVGINKYIGVHRLAMEEKLGRKLSSDEIVHHKNGDKLDNRLENLEIVDRASHQRIHKPRRKFEICQIAGCGKKHRGLGTCEYHYNRIHRK